MIAPTCAGCGRPRGAGFPRTQKDVDTYCWADYRVCELKAAVRHTLNCRDVGCERCLDLREKVEG